MPVVDVVIAVPWMMLPSDFDLAPRLRRDPVERLIPPGSPSHDTNTVAVLRHRPRPTACRARCWIVRIADQVTPLSVEVIIRMFPVDADVEVLLAHRVHRAAAVDRHRGIADERAGRVRNRDVLGSRSAPPSVENENAHTRVGALVHPAGERQAVRPGRQRDLGLPAVAGVVVEADVRA